MKIPTVLILFLFLASLSVKSQELEYSFKESYEISTPTKLNISSSDSDIKVLTHKKNTIDVYYIVRKNDELLKVNKEKPVYVYCRSGNRSGQACRIMEELGFENAYNLEGGILEWNGDVVDA